MLQCYIISAVNIKMLFSQNSIPQSKIIELSIKVARSEMCVVLLNLYVGTLSSFKMNNFWKCSSNSMNIEFPILKSFMYVHMYM